MMVIDQLVKHSPTDLDLPYSGSLYLMPEPKRRLLAQEIKLRQAFAIYGDLTRPLKEGILLHVSYLWPDSISMREVLALRRPT